MIREERLNHSGDFDAELVTATDYYPFGMILGGRNYAADGAHRFGFNGKENDNEVKGEGNSLDFGARSYDSRIARWSTFDPMRGVYPFISPYVYALNSPMNLRDEDGRIVTDKEGNIIVRQTGKTERFENERNVYIDGKFRKVDLIRNYSKVEIFADDGTPVEALKLISAYYEYRDNSSESTIRAFTGRDIDAKADCHGFTFAKNKLWINDNQVEKILNGDNYTETDEVNADIVIFRSPLAADGVYHSAIRTPTGMYDNNAGFRTTEWQVNLETAERGLLLNAVSKGTVAFSPAANADFRVKATPNTIFRDFNFTGPLNSNEKYADFSNSNVEDGQRTMDSDFGK